MVKEIILVLAFGIMIIANILLYKILDVLEDICISINNLRKGK